MFLQQAVLGVQLYPAPMLFLKINRKKMPKKYEKKIHIIDKEKLN